MLEQRKYDGHRKAQAAKKTWQNRENKKKWNKKLSRKRVKKANGIACDEPTQANYRIDVKWIKCWIAYSRAAGAKNANQLNVERA